METKDIYQQSLSVILEKTAPMKGADLVIGIPFLNELEKSRDILSILEAGLNIFYPDLKSLVICAVSPSSTTTTQTLTSSNSFYKDRVMAITLDKKLSGRGWTMRALLDLAHELTADLIILEPNFLLTSNRGMQKGFTSDWVKLMYQPVRDDHAQFVLPRFKLSYLDNCIADHFIFPLLGSLYNRELKGCLGAGMAISRRLLADLLQDVSAWPEEVYDYGMDYWLIMRAIDLKAEFAEVLLGSRPKTTMPAAPNYLFNQVVHVVFQAIGRGQENWKQNPQALRSVLNIGPREELFLQETLPERQPFMELFRRGFSRYYEAVWSRIFPEELAALLKKTAACNEDEFTFPDTFWSQLVYESLLAYHFIPELEKEDLAASLTPLFQGRLAGFLGEIDALSQNSSLQASCPSFARNVLERQVDSFISRRQVFLEKWLHHKEALQPFLPEIAYWEYIPGIPIVLPHLLHSSSGKSVHIAPLYEQLLKEYKEEFETFVGEVLSLSTKDGINKLGQAVRSMVEKVEKGLDQVLLPGNLHTREGTRKMAEHIYEIYSFPKSLSLKEEVAAQLLHEHPPRNLNTFWGYRDTEEMLQKHNPLDVLALASLYEDAYYTTWNREWLRKNLKPEHLKMSPVQPLVIDYQEFPQIRLVKEAPTLNHLTSRVVISNMRKGSGGSFPKIRFLTTFLKNIIEAEQFGMAWESFLKAPVDELGHKVINSIEGHWGVSMFSAHSIFENLKHRLLKAKLLQMSQPDKSETGEAMKRARQDLAQMAKVYHLGLTLTDGYYLTCSLWSWASYSSKGGKGIPTPLSLMIERRWFSSELFFRCYEQIEGPREEILSRIKELMGRGEENKNLVALLWDASSDSKKVIIPQKMEKDPPPAGKLKRSAFNPILTPVAEHQWESKYVLNCGAIRVNGDVNIFYRAVGEDGISRIGLALSKNGVRVDERFPEPVFSPGHESESMGVEDPRLIEIEGRFYMLYTAYDGITPQIALVSIDKDDLIHHRWQHWHRHGLVFPGFPNKDAVLFPERFDGKLAMYHRIAPSIWIAFSDTFDTPWPREGHKIIMGSRSGMMWDAVKIGAGAQPLKTRYGWLHIYHGVDYGFRYRLGVFLTSLHDPTEVVYRSPNPVLGPETSYEIGMSGSWVPNVVFTCGAVSVKDKAILDKDDEILVYYGGADTVIGVASARVGELIPECFT